MAYEGPKPTDLICWTGTGGKKQAGVLVSKTPEGTLVVREDGSTSILPSLWKIEKLSEAAGLN